MLRIIESQSLLLRAISSFVTGRACRRLLLAAAVLSILSAGPLALAVPINYGDFTGDTVDYLGVEEDSNSGDTLPLFGEPTVSGNSLDFDPVGFNANASGAAGNDVTDGNLNFVIMAHAGYGIQKVQLAEAGDTTLAGFGTDATFTSVTGTGWMNITEVDGVGIGTIPPVLISLSFTPSGGAYGLLTDGGGGPLYHSGWSGSWSQDIEQVLMANNVPFVKGATKVSINIDNTLTALSEAGTFALIAKKDFGGLSVTVFNIPEPATWILLAVCGLAAGTVRRTR